MLSQVVVPEAIGDYRILVPVGQGRTGMVYQALARATNQAVALKVVSAEHFPNADSRQKFLKEARAAAQLSHPNLRKLYEVGQNGDQVYLVMEYLEGITLKSLLVGGALEADTALAWGAEIANALVAAHAQGIVHGDLSPAKIFITQQSTVKVMDAGLWRLAMPARVDLSQEARLTGLQLRPATLAAMAPEQIRGQKPDARSDIFALGSLLYEMTTGGNPFMGPTTVQTMYYVLNRRPQPVSQRASQVPAALDVIVARALEKKPQARFRTASELAVALRALAATEELPREVPKPSKARRMAVWVGVGMLVVLLLAWVFHLLLGRL